MESFRYFSTPYPLSKLDMVAVPEFSAGAMENYGLITYRENDLLYDDLLSPAARKQIVSRISNHPLASFFSFHYISRPST
jgi:puromycin-sensitive aminopeptidase